MSHDAYRWAMNLELRSTDKMVLTVLADCHNGKSGQCNPAMATIAKRAGLSERCVKDVVKRLEKTGLIAVRRGTRGGMKVANRYELSIGKAIPTFSSPPSPKSESNAYRSGQQAPADEDAAAHDAEKMSEEPGSGSEPNGATGGEGEKNLSNLQRLGGIEKW
ncbi:MAG: helix-turn-helix domain-containing protein [Burkholderiales bacterium]|nr:helix-turn-helix domain-containing protein [Burkholderiales bacterium]